MKNMSGEVFTSNMYENIKNVPSLKDIEAMGPEGAKECFETVRRFHKMKDLIAHWGTNSYHVYHNVFPKYKLGAMKDVSAATAARHGQQPSITDFIPTQVISLENPRNKLNSLKFGFNITLEGKFLGKAFMERLTNINTCLSVETDYQIKLSMSELIEDNQFNFDLGGTYNGKLIQDRLLNLQGIINNDDEYMVQYIVEEKEPGTIDFTVK